MLARQQGLAMILRRSVQANRGLPGPDAIPPEVGARRRYGVIYLTWQQGPK